MVEMALNSLMREQHEAEHANAERGARDREADVQSNPKEK
jgi:hypothetical protein